MFVDYGDRFLILNKCQSDCKKSLPKANRIIGKTFPIFNRIARIEILRTNCLILECKNFPSQLFFQAPHYMILYLENFLFQYYVSGYTIFIIYYNLSL